MLSLCVLALVGVRDCIFSNGIATIPSALAEGYVAKNIFIKVVDK